jgi:hypothetical protein
LPRFDKAVSAAAAIAGVMLACNFDAQRRVSRSVATAPPPVDATRVAHYFVRYRLATLMWSG